MDAPATAPGRLWRADAGGTMAPMDAAALLERILGGEAPAVLLHGPAACGKTAGALALHARFARPTGGGCLLIAPNYPAASNLRRRIVRAAPTGAVAAPRVTTFAALAAGILADAGDGGRMLSPVARQRLLRRIVRELAEAGELRALAASADTPGLILSLDRSIAELKRAAVEPEDLARALAPGDAKGRDLATVYARYQERMRAAETYDVEGQMWRAREHLENDEGLAALADVEAVAVDGFTDFTPTQLAILAGLAPRLTCLLITLPLAADGRGRLWHWTARTRERIRDAFGGDLHEIALDRDRAGPAGAPLVDRVFDFDAAPCAPPDALRLISAAGVDAEVAAVATRIKRLLLAEPAGLRVAMLARSLDAYREPIERIFAECDVPVAAAPRPLTAEPVVRFALDAAALAPDYPSPDVLRVIKSSYFRPGAIGEFTEGDAVVAEMVIRHGNVLDGRESYLAAAERLARRATSASGPPEPDEDEPADAAPALGPLRPTDAAIRRAGDMLAALFDLVDRAASEGVPALVEGLRLHEAAEAHAAPETAARDLRALAALTSALDSAGEVIPPGELRDALDGVAIAGERREAMVDVLDVLDARPLRYDHVFLLGLGEGQFPRQFAEGSLLSEPQREDLAARGIDLDTRGDLTAREMLLFYLAASRSDGALTLSWLASDAAGRPGAPGSFLQRLLDPIGGIDGEAARERTAHLPPGRFIPPADELASRRDALVAAAAGAFLDGGETGPPALAWAGAAAPRVLARAARGLWSLHQRERRGPCDAHDGRIESPELQAVLAERFGEGAVFSAAQLNAYGGCPWQFFAAYVLRLEPLPEPTRRLEALDRGTFCHNVLFRAMRRLADESGGPVRLRDLPEERIDAALAAAVAAESEQVELRRPAYPGLWRVQRDAMATELAAYLRTSGQAGELAAASTHFELGFGLPAPAREEQRDPHSRAEPVTLATPAGALRLRGKIDRVDRVRFGDADGSLVVDYKTGGLPPAKDVAAGRNLQLPLYAAAVEAMLGEPSLGGAFHRVLGDPSQQRTFAAFKLYGGTYRPNDGYADQLDTALTAAAGFIERIRAGQFDALPTHDCPSWCPYRQICHFAEWRAERKERPEPVGEPGKEAEQ